MTVVVNLQADVHQMDTHRTHIDVLSVITVCNAAISVNSNRNISISSNSNALHTLAIKSVIISDVSAI